MRPSNAAKFSIHSIEMEIEAKHTTRWNNDLVTDISSNRVKESATSASAAQPRLDSFFSFPP